MMAVLCGVAALSGHLFPLYLHFKGGKGAATGVGMVFGFNWQAGLVAMGVFLVLFLATRMVSVGSILGAASCPITHYFSGGRYRAEPVQIWIVLIPLIVMSLAVIVMHRANILRILKGTEQRIRLSRKSE
jgi:glycerol-3-phosphate acyltransferase PlsY